MGKNNYS